MFECILCFPSCCSRREDDSPAEYVSEVGVFCYYYFFYIVNLYFFYLGVPTTLENFTMFCFFYIMVTGGISRMQQH